MTVLDHQYLYLLKNILEKGHTATTRNGKTKSLPAFQISHSCMENGFPILECKKVPFKTVVTELVWFLAGCTSIEFLLRRNCHIWTGDAMVHAARTLNENHFALDESKELLKIIKNESIPFDDRKKQFSDWLVSALKEISETNFIYTDLRKKESDVSIFCDLGPIYGSQWRNYSSNNREFDQINKLLSTLKSNPDDRRMIVSAWNIADLDYMALPPCHYGFQVYTRELSGQERANWKLSTGNLAFYECYHARNYPDRMVDGERDARYSLTEDEYLHKLADSFAIPRRAVSLIWNQRSTDVPLGLPFNIASYGLLLHLIAKTTDMIPDMLYGNLTNVHVYENQINACRSILDTFETKKTSSINKPDINFQKIIDSKGDRWLSSILNDVYYHLDTDKNHTEYDEIISLLTLSLTNYHPEKKVSIPLSN